MISYPQIISSDLQKTFKAAIECMMKDTSSVDTCSLI